MSPIHKTTICSGILLVAVAIILATPRQSQAVDRYWPRYWQWYDREYAPYYYSPPKEDPDRYSYFRPPYDRYRSLYPPGYDAYRYHSPAYVEPRIGRSLPGAVYWY